MCRKNNCDTKQTKNEKDTSAKKVNSTRTRVIQIGTTEKEINIEINKEKLEQVIRYLGEVMPYKCITHWKTVLLRRECWAKKISVYRYVPILKVVCEQNHREVEYK